MPIKYGPSSPLFPRPLTTVLWAFPRPGDKQASESPAHCPMSPADPCGLPHTLASTRGSQWSRSVGRSVPGSLCCSELCFPAPLVPEWGPCCGDLHLALHTGSLAPLTGLCAGCPSSAVGTPDRLLVALAARPAPST